MEGVGETMHEITDDDARPVDSADLEMFRRAGSRLGKYLASLVVVARCLADVEFSLEDPPLPEAADVGA